MRELIERKQRGLYEGMLPQENIKRGEVRGDGRSGDVPSGALKAGLKASDLIGWFANKYNLAAGWTVYAPTAEEKAEFGANARRVYSERTGSMSVVKFNLAKGTVAFLDNKAYEDGTVKYDRGTAYDRIIIENTPKAFKAFGIV